MPTTAAIIVAYRSAAVLGRCIESVLPHVDEVLVIDNSPDEETAQVAARYPVKLLRHPENLGFAGAVNQGVRSCDAGLLLLLNPDVTLAVPILPLVEACQRPGAGAAAGLLVDPQGHPQTGFSVRRLPTPAALIFECLGLNRLWPGNPVNRRWRGLDLDLTRAQPVEQPAGALLLFRRDVWQRLGGFDERFHPLWFEDVDFLSRLRLDGYTVWFDPAVRATHDGGHSLGGLTSGIRQEYWYGNLLRYAAKHFGPLSLRATAVAVLAGVVARNLMTGNLGSFMPGEPSYRILGLGLRVLLRGAQGVGPGRAGKQLRKQ